MNGQIRLTEQGEVIASKYAHPEIGRRNLETLVAATLEATLLQSNDAVPDEFLDAAERISDASMAAYRALVYETPGFTDYFFSATPIREIAELNIGSRPASRKASRRIEDLRAIPWSFTWGQCRVACPAGTASARPSKRFLADGAGARAWRCCSRCTRVAVLRTLLSNLDMVLAKSDLALARRYVELVDDRAMARRLFGVLEAEWQRTVEALTRSPASRSGCRQPGAGALDPAPLPLPRPAEPPAGRADAPLARRRAG